MMICSRNSVTSFIERFISIHPPAFFFFQTLTFHPQLKERDAFVAKKLFDKLRKNLQIQFPKMAAIYVQQLHADGDIHYHVFFFFFDAAHIPFPPASRVSSFRRIVFKAWNSAQGGGLAQIANRLTEHKKNDRSLDYIIRDRIRLRTPNDPPTPKRPHWWGEWNKKLLNANATNPPRKKVLWEFWTYFGDGQLPIKKKPMTSTERSRKWREEKRMTF